MTMHDFRLEHFTDCMYNGHYLPNILAILVCHVADGVEPALSQYNFNMSSKMTMARALSPEEMELRDALNRHATNNPGNPGKNVSLSITIKGSNYIYKQV